MAFGDKFELALEPPAHIEDMRGRVFGNLTVVEYGGRNVFGQSIWKSICIEGNVVFPRTGDLKSGKTKSCGCLQKSHRTSLHKQNYSDHTNKKYGHLVGIRDTGKRYKTKNGTKSIWLWLCTFNGPGCKGEVEIKSKYVVTGNTVSCGCYFNRKNIINAKALNRKKLKGEDKNTAFAEAEWEYEQQDIHLAAERTRAAAMNWGNKLPEPQFNWTNKLPGEVTVIPDFDWWKDKLKGQDNENS